MMFHIHVFHWHYEPSPGPGYCAIWHGLCRCGITQVRSEPTIEVR